MPSQDNSCQIEPLPVQTFDIAMSLPDEMARIALQTDGVICLRNAHDQKWLSLIESGINEALNGASQNLDIVKKADDGGQFSFSSQAWRQVDTFREAIFGSRAPDIAWQLLDCASINLFYDFLLIKEACTNRAATPWHQDHAYYPLKGQGVINCWTALDTIPMETALRFWAGSHRKACLFQAANFAGGSDYQHVQSDHPEIPDIDNDRALRILACELSPGICSYGIHSRSIVPQVILWAPAALHSQSTGQQTLFDFAISQALKVIVLKIFQTATASLAQSFPKCVPV